MYNTKSVFTYGFIWRGSGRHQRRRLRVGAEDGGGDTSPFSIVVLGDEDMKHELFLAD